MKFNLFTAVCAFLVGLMTGIQWLWFGLDSVYVTMFIGAIWLYVYQFVKTRDGWEWLRKLSTVGFYKWFEEIHTCLGIAVLVMFPSYLILYVYELLYR